MKVNQLNETIQQLSSSMISLKGSLSNSSVSLCLNMVTKVDEKTLIQALEYIHPIGYALISTMHPNKFGIYSCFAPTCIDSRHTTLDILKRLKLYKIKASYTFLNKIVIEEESLFYLKLSRQ
jgi:hypothetical protein